MGALAMPRGRKPKPFEQKKLSGTLRKDRLTVVPGSGQGEASPPKAADIPPAPEHLDGIALLTWQETAALLLKRGTLGDEDLATLESYCITYEQMRVAKRELEDEGQVLTTDKGNKYKNPSATILNECQRQLNSLRAELGIGTSNRAKFAPNGGEKSNPFAAVQRRS